MIFEISSRRGWRGRRWYFSGVADNGEIILQSEGYHNLQDARDTVDVIREQAMGAEVHVEWPDGSRKAVGPKG